MRRTKIICTLGPSSNDSVTIEKLMKAGMNAARFNFSHGNHAEQGARLTAVQRLRDKLGLNVACILDTAGPSIRTGRLEGGKNVMLTPGSLVTLTREDVPGRQGLVSVPNDQFYKLAKKGSRVFIADGLFEFLVKDAGKGELFCEVVTGGMLGERKNVNVPGADVDVPAITENDKVDVAFGLKRAVDYVAMSFVKTGADVRAMRKHIGTHPAGIIAKIEHPRAVKNLDEIVREADAVMVARGDLGVQFPSEDVPLIQKRIIQQCRQASKPVIVATQMLESMTSNSRPTRAEASDVANAVLDGADAVMLSGETANGAYPLQALSVMGRICEKAETIPIELRLPHAGLNGLMLPAAPKEADAAIAHAAVGIAHDLDAAAILTPTESGASPTRVSHYRPRVPIVAFSTHPSTCRKLSIVWGVDALSYHAVDNTDALVRQVATLARQHGYGKSGDAFVVTAGVPLGVQGSTNLVKVVRT